MSIEQRALTTLRRGQPDRVPVFIYLNHCAKAWYSDEPSYGAVLEQPPIGDTVVADAKRLIGDRVCLIGNLQYDDLARGTPEQVERMVREAIEQGGAGGGSILSPCASPYERSLTEKASANLVRDLKAGRKYGRYGARG